MSYTIDVWGNCVWYLFHTLIHIIKDDQFLELKNDIVYIIKTVIQILPCPDCSRDATLEINKVDFNAIQTKQQLKLLMFNFHNHINKKLNKPIFQLSQLDEKYSKANIHVIINNFNIIFSTNSNIPHLMNQSFNRNINIPKIKIILNKIISKLN